jgi:hypothetical protein
MGETTETIIYYIKLDVAATQAGLKDFAKDINSVADANKNLKDSIGQTEEAAKRQETAAKKTSEALKAEEGSIAAIREANKKLTAERNATSLATDAGRKRVEELNKQLDANNKQIKENVDAYTKQKIGIGDYSGALDKLIPGLGATTQGIINSTKASLAFIATPIGLVITALGLAIASVIEYFKGSEEGQNKWNKVTQYGSALLEQLKNVAEALGGVLVGLFENPIESIKSFGSFLLQNIINRFVGMLELLPKLGEAVGLLFEGEFSKAGQVALDAIGKVALGVEGVTQKVIDFTKEVSASVNQAIKDAERLANIQAKIDADERKLIVERAKTNLEVAKLREQAITQEGEAKKKTIEAAIALEKQLSDIEVAHAKDKLAQAQLELKINGDDKEAKLAVAKATADVINAEATRFEATLRFQKELERLNEAEIKAAEDKAAALKKIEEDHLNDMDDMAKIKAAQKKKDADAELATAKKLADQKLAIEQKGIDSAGKLSLLATKGKIDLQKTAQNFFKEGAAKETIVNTKAAALAAYKALASIPVVGPVLGGIAYAAVLAKGLADAAGIRAIPFAKGGRALSGTRINRSMGLPITRSNGDNILATVKDREVILNEQQQAALGGDQTFRRIGVPGFADGGSTSISQAIETSSAFNAISARDNSPIVIPAVILQDFELAQNTKNESENRARIL